MTENNNADNVDYGVMPGHVKPLLTTEQKLFLIGGKNVISIPPIRHFGGNVEFHLTFIFFKFNFLNIFLIIVRLMYFRSYKIHNYVRSHNTYSPLRNMVLL